MIERLRTNSSQSIASSASVPENFYCPLSCEVMREPVTTEHGHVFERAWIKQIIDSGRPCPLTRKLFVTRKLVAHRDLKTAIARHPQAAAEAQEAAAPPASQQYLEGPAGPPTSLTLSHFVGSNVLAATDSIMERFLLGNPAGAAHRCFSRANLLVKIDTAKRELRLLESQGGRLDTRAHLAGRIRELETRLAFARAASPVTMALDVVLGSYTAEEIDPHNWRRVGLTGMALWPFALCGGPLPGLVAQSASLLGASVKATVRLAAQGPAKTANALARYQYARNA